MKRNKSNKGFTLIELIIVTVIIGIMSAFFVNTSLVYLKRGRDGRRQSDLEKIRTGIETYKADCNSYPAVITFGGSLVGTDASVNCPAANTYINTIPQDPQSTNGYSYLYYSNGTTYEICASLELGNGTITCGGSSSCGSGTCNYRIKP